MLNYRWLHILAIAGLVSLGLPKQSAAQTSITHIYTDEPGACWTLFSGEPSWGTGVQSGCGNAAVTTTSGFDFIHLDDVGIAYELPVSCEALFITPDNSLQCFSAGEVADPWTEGAGRLSACLNACAQGEISMAEFCRSIKNAKVRALCWAAAKLGGAACDGFCYARYTMLPFPVLYSCDSELLYYFPGNPHRLWSSTWNSPIDQL